ncbi:MAG: tRNA (adenosine(37)-N6)-threonylcarbamoyltransferase complex dimerization subunit type 1 TsaB [Alphaproteobacteria bacterium]
MVVLGMDTSHDDCAVYVLKDGAMLCHALHPKKRGHAEILVSFINEVLEKVNLTFSDLDCISPIVGPGSFTGLRVGISAARGLALALNTPCIGVSLFEAINRAFLGKNPGEIAISSHREDYFVQSFEDGVATTAPSIAKANDEMKKYDMNQLDSGDLAKVHQAHLSIAGKMLVGQKSYPEPVPLYIRELSFIKSWD